jgi:WD40 repeat protein
VPDGKPLSGEVVLQGHAGAVTGLAFSGDGQRLISTGGDGTLRVWDTRGEIMRTIESATGRPTAMAIEGARVAIGHEDGTVEVWDLEAVQRVDFFRRNQAPIWALTFAGDLQRIAAASHDWVVTLWDRRRGGAPDHQFQGHANAVQAVAYAPASGIIASAGADKTVRLWHAADRRELRVLRGHEEFVSSLAIAPSGGLIASGSHDRRIRVWSVGDGAQKRTLLAPGGRVTSLAFAPDEDVLVSGGDDGTARIWNWRRGRVLRTLGGHRGSVRHVAIARDGRSIATGGEDGTIRVWTLQPAMQTSASKTYRFSE